MRDILLDISCYCRLFASVWKYNLRKIYTRTREVVYLYLHVGRILRVTIGNK